MFFIQIYHLNTNYIGAYLILLNYYYNKNNPKSKL